MADILAFLQTQGINKKIIYPGTGEIPDFEDGTKIYFHYKTTKCDEEKTILDDSRKHEKPMELIIGKKFKLEVWETCLKSMKVKEVADYLVDRTHAAVYPLVSKSLRDIFLKHKHGHQHEERSSCCGMMSHQGTGYPDLDELVKNPQSLIFSLELLKIERCGEYEKESWVMDEAEKLDAIPKLREEGNRLYQGKQYKSAAEKYGEALGMLEQLVLREKPGDEEWTELENMKVPFLLNYSQCQLLLQDYYPVIEHTTTVLKTHPDNVKALYRRAKAHVGAWNPEEARTDYLLVMELDPTLETTVKKELKSLDEKIKEKNSQDKEKLQGLFS